MPKSFDYIFAISCQPKFSELIEELELVPIPEATIVRLNGSNRLAAGEILKSALLSNIYELESRRAYIQEEHSPIRAMKTIFDAAKKFNINIMYPEDENQTRGNEFYESEIEEGTFTEGGQQLLDDLKKRIESKCISIRYNLMSLEGEKLTEYLSDYKFVSWLGLPSFSYSFSKDAKIARYANLNAAKADMLKGHLISGLEEILGQSKRDKCSLLDTKLIINLAKALKIDEHASIDQILVPQV